MDAADGYGIRPAPDRPPGPVFVPVPDGKAVENRPHPGFRPEDREAKAARLLALGARRADAGQGEQSWQVLTDIEGDGFRVLSPRRT